MADTDKILLAQGGDGEAFAAVAASNVGLIVHTIKSNNLDNNTGLSMSECVSDGYIGLAKAIRSYKPAAGASFATWACRLIRFEILTGARHEMLRRSRHMTLEPELVPPTRDQPCVSEALIRSIDVQAVAVFLDLWKRRSPRDHRDAQILELIVGIDRRGPCGYEQVADIVGVPRKRVWVLANQAFHRACAEFGQAAPGVSLFHATRSNKRKRKKRASPDANR